jgi:ParB family chromosome partitioning protein
LFSAKKNKNKLLSAKEQYDLGLQELSSRLRTKFGTKVDIKRKQNGGEIRIEYYNNDELDRLLLLFDQMGNS